MKQCKVCGNRGEGQYCGVCGSPFPEKQIDQDIKNDEDQFENQSSSDNHQNTYQQNSYQNSSYQPQGGYAQNGNYQQPNQHGSYQQYSGYGQNGYPPYNQQFPPYIPKQKRSNVLPIVLGVIGGIIILVAIGVIAFVSLISSVTYDSFNDYSYYDDYNEYNDYYSTSDGSWFLSNPTESYSTQLISGNYVVGVDIPVGVYDLTIEKGFGNIYSEFTEEYSSYYNFETLEYIENNIDALDYELNNIMLPEGTVLIITGMTVNLTSDTAEVSTKGERTNTLQNEVSLQPGVYTAGVDFELGTYNVVAVDGTGYVYSDSYTSSGYLDEYFSSVTDGFYINEYKNVEFEDGDILTTDITIKLVPSN